MSENNLFTFCEYDQTVRLPNLRHFRSTAICNWLINEIFLMGETDEKRTEMWRYDISKNTWLQMNSSQFNFYQSSSTPKPTMAFDNSGRMVISGCSMSENFQSFFYDVSSESCIKLKTSGKTLYVGNQVYDPIYIHKKAVTVFSSESQLLIDSKFYRFSTKDGVWKNLSRPCHSFASKPFQYTFHENKVFVFASHLVEGILTCAQTVYCYDVKLRKWSDLVTTPIDPQQRPNGVKCYCLLQNENFFYFIGGFRVNPTGRFNRKVWRFDVKNLAWSLMPIVLPEGEVKFLSDLNTVGEMYVGYEKGIYKINL